MKKILFLALASFSLNIHSLFSGCCSLSSCSDDCFGFDSVTTFGVGGGYREDSLKWQIFPADIPGRVIQEQWKHVGLGIVELNAQFLACEHFYLKADFDFGWFSNNGSQRYCAHGGNETIINNRSKPTGNVYDLSGGVGYQFNFDCVGVSFAPLIGYSTHQQRYKHRTYKNLIFPESGIILAHNNYKFRWGGPWVGFALAYQATCEFQLYFDYYYHWTRFRGSVRENFWIGSYENRLRTNRAHGNEFIVGGVYTFCDYWYVGVKFDYKQFSGNKGKSRFERVDFSSPFRKLDWRSSTITLDIGYAF